MSHQKSWPIFAALSVVLALTATLCLASIENKPIKVTHRNSGPKYEFDDVERMRIPERPEASSNNNEANQVESNLHRVPLRNDNEPASEDAMSAGPQLSIRRIFLVPMSRNPFESDRSEERESPQTNPFGYPLNPFFIQPRPAHRFHMFGEDPASRSPTPEASETSPQKEGERESPSSEMPTRPMLDPVKLLMELMNHALNPSPQGQSPMGSFFNDLSKEASAANGNRREQEESVDKKQVGSELDRPNVDKPPMSNNETREDVVEIDGKKYLRKTIINRHVGENIIFMTKRLIFVPLNETDPELSTTTTTTSPIGNSESQPATTTVQPPSEPSSTQEPERTKPEEVATTTTTTTTVASESPNTSASEVPSIPTTTSAPVESSPTTTTTSTTTTGASNAEETTPKDDMSSWTSGPSDMPERLVDIGADRTQDGSSTPKPTTELPRV